MRSARTQTSACLLTQSTWSRQRAIVQQVRERDLFCTALRIMSHRTRTSSTNALQSWKAVPSRKACLRSISFCKPYWSFFWPSLLVCNISTQPIQSQNRAASCKRCHLTLNFCSLYRRCFCWQVSAFQPSNEVATTLWRARSMTLSALISAAARALPPNTSSFQRDIAPESTLRDMRCSERRTFTRNSPHLVVPSDQVENEPLRCKRCRLSVSLCVLCRSTWMLWTCSHQASKALATALRVPRSMMR
mmetsp:Transcript_46727/g.74760  ORF Transcript_46727/g.74760 Transcript_46727/m.74760 type:complete len:247 (+) Transcript_46727:1314-2054(+)